MIRPEPALSSAACSAPLVICLPAVRGERVKTPVKTKEPLELAVLCDFREEGWPSMDLVADKLLAHLDPAQTAVRIRPTRVCPPLKVRFGRMPFRRLSCAGRNADRLLNRMYDYPAAARKLAAQFDLFHICDHSYAQLVHDLPRGRSGVFCHDLDTFRCLLEPEQERRPLWFKAMARRILRGLENAALVFYTTSTVRNAIERYGLVDSARLVQAPYGISEEFGAGEGHAHAADHLLRGIDGAPFLLHVGSCIRRKRIDVLLDAFGTVRRAWPGLRLVQVGGEWSAVQRAQLARLGLEHAVLQLPRLSQELIAALYRNATLVLMPSESEGFGLPVVEAMACGGVVVASNIPVFREIGGEAVVYCPMGDAQAWAETIDRLLASTKSAPALELRLRWAQQFSWREHAQRIAQGYAKIA